MEIDYPKYRVEGYPVKPAGLDLPSHTFISCRSVIPKSYGDIAKPFTLGKRFTVNKPVSQAVLFSTALGLYKAEINQKPVFDHLLAPEWTNYRKRVLYQICEITDLIKPGENRITATVSNGWYSGMWQLWPPRPYMFGRYPLFWAELHIIYKDHTKEIINADKSWVASTGIPLTFAGIYEGETYDASISAPDLSDPKKWKPVFAEEQYIELCPQINEPIRVTERLKAVKITSPSPDCYVVDFGQNAAGRIRCRFREKSGSLVTIEHNEMLREDGHVYMDNLIAGCFLEKADRQILRYRCKGDPEGEEYAPDFTYMGFRYIEITGLSKAPRLSDFTFEVFHSDFRQTGTFNSSDSDLNRFWKNVWWSQRSNMMSVPTDCPQRDERCGYTGDMQVFTPTALMNADMSSFMHKWLTDLCEDSQFADGSYSDHAPFYGRIYTVNVGWGDAGVICPYLCYKTYGDIEFISAHYDSMKRFAAYLTRYANIDHTWRSLSDGNGDHLAKGGGVSKEVMGSIYFAYILGLMAQIAEALGRPDDAAYYLGEYTLAKKAFIREYILPDGKIRDSSLTGFALAITMDLVPDTMMSAVSAAFAEEIARLGYQAATGFIGTSRLLTALNRIDRDDLADKLLFNRKCPSWLYPVTKGATTIWERWDGWTDEKGFADRGMNSFNHFAFGSAGEYLYHCVLGIQQAPESVAYQDIVIKPSILQSLNFAAGSYESVRGKISSSWKIENNICTLEVEIPEGPDAKVILSAEGKVEAPCPEETGRDACRVFKVKPGHSVFRFTPHPGLVKGNL